MNDELAHLDEIASRSLYAAGPSGDLVRHGFRVFSRFYNGGSILEMGPAEGLMTDFLARLDAEMTIVEGSREFCEDLARRFPRATVVNSLFEDFDSEKRFDNILLGHVLEHVSDPVGVLKKVASLLSPRGQIFAAVPNARSLHRQLGVMLGMLDFEESMNDLDRAHGHRRVYNPETFRREFNQAGLRIEFFGGYWIKCFSNSQMEKVCTPEMLQALFRLGERYPDIASDIYVLATLPR